MPLPFVVIATAQVAAETAGVSLWGYAGGVLGGGGIIYYRDSIYHWFFPKPCVVLPENDCINNQSVVIQAVQERVVEAQVNSEKTSEVNASILIDVKQDAEKTQEVVNQVQDINVVEIETFESLLQKITNNTSEKLDNILGTLETIKDSLTLDQIKIIQTVIKISKENQLLRESNEKQQKIVMKLDKINLVLQQKLLRFEGLIEVKNQSPTISVRN